MTLHKKFDEVKLLVEHGVPVLLEGGRGSGKTTLAKDVANALGLKLYSISLTRQTTLGMIMGFINVAGKYVPSDLFKAATGGGLMLLDELNAADANVLLCLNTIENGYISFPEHGIVELHKDFRLIATQNPNTSEYSGRTKLDGATLDRFDEISIDLDGNLERSLVDPDVYQKICLMRETVKELNVSKDISMRDCLRLQKRKELGLETEFVERIFGDDKVAINLFHEKYDSAPKFKSQQECENVDELIELLEKDNG